MDTRRLKSLDLAIGEIDKVIKTLTLSRKASRTAPQAAGGHDLTQAERAESARLMRVNHSGEVAAQALYQGQALTARAPQVKAAMQQAAAEEVDHLAWCAQRLEELNGRPSVLNPIWYAGALALGAIAGVFGDRASLGLIAETEKQVESHLREHLELLSPDDLRSRAILEQMTHDEVQHGAKAASLGGKPLPFAITLAMRLTSRLMTRGSYWI
ncbi:MAG TPA: 2-polyprenyl-3-methyl-6-methoxy-1,4-benzoquinone monooxygenase [Steroidobacteraceae bacterium]|jgi:ubiquinone biosynthesis monooxygenase Coq7|nr:2-polyprenyl-3-methyl-6-methoxy-1,4-benzoquinone monooxygenase [Steroidobacteraceae bacterium]